MTERDDTSREYPDVRGSRRSSVRQPAPTNSRTYTLEAGDTLEKIAQREYGDGNKWRAIHQANKEKIKDPQELKPGLVINLPSDV